MSGNVGAAWYRLFKEREPGYGFVDEQTPELSIAVVPSLPRQGLRRGAARGPARPGEEGRLRADLAQRRAGQPRASPLRAARLPQGRRERRQLDHAGAAERLPPTSIKPDGSRRRSSRRRPRRLHGRDPRRAARREGRLHREGARARRHVPPRRMHPDEGVGADGVLDQGGRGDVREARRQRRRAAARLRQGERVEGRRRQADDERRRRASSRRTASSGSRAPARSRTRTRSPSKAART